MSHEEMQKQQADTISGIDDKLTHLSSRFEKWLKLWAIGGGVLAVVSGIGGFAIGAYKYDANIVKQPQLARTVVGLNRKDSSLNAKIDHTAFIDSARYQQIKNLFSDDKLAVPKVVFGGVTEYKDKRGKIHLLPAQIN